MTRVNLPQIFFRLNPDVIEPIQWACSQQFGIFNCLFAHGVIEITVYGRANVFVKKELSFKTCENLTL